MPSTRQRIGTVTVDCAVGAYLSSAMMACVNTVPDRKVIRGLCGNTGVACKHCGVVVRTTGSKPLQDGAISNKLKDLSMHLECCEWKRRVSAARALQDLLTTPGSKITFRDLRHIVSDQVINEVENRIRKEQ